MRDWSLGARLAITLLVSFVASIAHAAADDMLVMPYSCAVVDGKPVLRPSDEEHGHRIYGARERKKIETCSTVDSKRCRQWTAFKFDMDCGGARVSWMQVFANASDHTRRRVWEHNGRLRVRDTPMRSARIDDICARRMGPQMEWSNTSQLCDETSPLTAPTATTMPAGFAPMVGLDAAFLSGEAFERMSARWARAEGESPAANAADLARPSAAPAKTLAPADASRTTDAVPKAETTSIVLKPAPVAAQAKAPSVAPLKPVEDARQQPARNEPDTAVVETRVETAANRETAVQDPETEPAAVAVPETGPAPAQETAPKVLNAAHAETAEPPPASSPAAIEQQPSRELIAETVATETAEVAGNSDHAVTYLIVALASGLLMITLLGVHWLGTAKPVHESAPAAAPDVHNAPATVASASEVQAASVFAASPAGPAPLSDNALIVVKSRKRDSRQNDHTSLMPAARTLSIGERMPSTKNEALELLGMGVATDDNLTSLKKIIDGLRMNWHPDLAADDSDRRTRELRLKQINAAWEILGGKSAGA